jgi:hypothetical protein
MRVWEQTHLYLSMTEAGKVLLHGTACILLAALIVPAFGILAALAAVLLTALIAGFVLRPRVQVRGNLPDSVIVGQAAHFRYKIENGARVSAYQLSVEIDSLPASIERLNGSHLIPRLTPGATTELTLDFTMHRRGRFLIPAPVCRSGFPFNLFVFGLSHAGDQPLLVLPPVYPLRLTVHDRIWRLSSSGGGFTARTEVSPEYAGNRPFVTGDSPRHIDARAWARLSVPATKEYYADQDKLAVLVLDSRVPGLSRRDVEPNEPFEAAVCLCASAAFTLERDCFIDSVLIGPTLHRFAQVPTTHRFTTLHQMLATVEPSDGYDLESTGQEMEADWRQTSEAVFILLTWDKMYSRLIEQAARAGCHTTVLLLDGSTRAGAPPMDAEGTVWARQVNVLSPHDVLMGRMGDL